MHRTVSIVVLFLSLSVARADWQSNAVAWTGGPEVAIFGDSIAACFSNCIPILDGGPSGNTTTADSAWLLNRDTGGQVTATNYGKSGSTLYKLRTDGSLNAIHYLTNTHCKYAILLDGVNDIISSNLTFYATKSNLDLVMPSLAASNIALIISELDPDNGTVNTALFKSWNAAELEWVNTNTVGTAFFMYSLTNMGSAFLNYDYKQSWWTWDTVHRTPEGSERWITASVIPRLQTIDPATHWPISFPIPVCSTVTDSLTNDAGGFKAVGDLSSTAYLSSGQWTCSNTLTSCKVRFPLSRVAGTYTGNLTAMLYSDSSGNVGSRLAVGQQVAASTCVADGGHATLMDFIFSYAFVSGTKYQWVLYSDTADATLNIGWWCTGDTTKLMSSSSDGSSWSGKYSQQAIFILLGNTAPLNQTITGNSALTGKFTFQ